MWGALTKTLMTVRSRGAATVPEKAPLPATGEAMTLSLYVSCELITSNKRGYCRGFGIGA